MCVWVGVCTCVWKGEGWGGGVYMTLAWASNFLDPHLIDFLTMEKNGKAFEVIVRFCSMNKQTNKQTEI